MQIFYFFDNKFRNVKILRFIWFLVYYVLKQYHVFKPFCNKFTYNFVCIYDILLIQFWHYTSVNFRLSCRFRASLLWMLPSLFKEGSLLRMESAFLQSACWSLNPPAFTLKKIRNKVLGFFLWIISVAN